MRSVRLFFGIIVIGVVVPFLFLAFYTRFNSVEEILSFSQQSSLSQRSSLKYVTKEDYCNSPEAVTEIRPQMLRNIFVNDKYKILYCAVPKIACTNWKRIFIILSGKVDETDPMKLKAREVHGILEAKQTHLSDFSPEEINHRIKNYYKFMFTREPFERLLSAYRNKFASNNVVFRRGFGKKILARYRLNPSRKEVLTGAGVTFLEFIQYLVDSTREEALNSHWKKLTDMCHPCLIKYDLIGDMDNINDDATKILDRVGASSKVEFPRRDATYKHKDTGSVLYHFYSQVPRGFLNQLYNMYYSDFLMYDYKIPTTIRNLTKWRRM
ncbi:carbohydrate sulfotransferase 11-like [Gigantopelta aegis]|uniref:carbohydrate sulfotransferase 11-like n=1 Tax=Gigantopelta aegis TaxID=1735272 RepID=UPI001B887844|nr:carbohydrate sulfotransferase 11-like [Gigantopelta aegis]XP_041357000.1 carbohydrate sulfotransferase 11-like [Gigantopelta aegis]XP_041357001.1 carbohydrate sulfotransferase 11-like [Gigantopelta aegis]XP_041357002.1 carbohydrate sulfotransferase 11-like [Gigantopelta aegis]XP_041357003.1 carbohydrate sulfotransferase 11-like [Gigantopelta aegis]